MSDNWMPEARPDSRYCRRCRSVTLAELQRTIGRNYITLVHWICTKCHRPTDLGSLAHAPLKRMGIEIDLLPLRRDNSELLCEVEGCGNPGAEYHHWAPWAIFGVWAGDWPTSLLCRHHHRLWHSRMTGTPAADLQPDGAIQAEVEERLSQRDEQRLDEQWCHERDRERAAELQELADVRHSMVEAYGESNL